MVLRPASTDLHDVVRCARAVHLKLLLQRAQHAGHVAVPAAEVARQLLRRRTCRKDARGMRHDTEPVRCTREEPNKWKLHREIWRRGTFNRL